MVFSHDLTRKMKSKTSMKKRVPDKSKSVYGVMSVRFMWTVRHITVKTVMCVLKNMITIAYSLVNVLEEVIFFAFGEL